MNEKESECPIQGSCQDFVPTKSGKSCVHYSVDEYGNDECHIEYDDEEWDLENE